MSAIFEDLQTITTPGGTSGTVIDTAGLTRIVYEVRWSFAGAPGALAFNPYSTNDSGIHPDTWTGFIAYPPNVQPDGSNTGVLGTLQAAGRGIIVLVNPARYATLDTYFSGTTGTITVRAFGWVG